MGKFALGCIVAFVLIALLFGGLIMFGVGKLSDNVEAQVGQHPVIIEHLGTIEEVDVDLTPSGEDKNQKGRAIINITGSKAQGVLYAPITGEDQTNPLGDGELMLESGELIPIIFEKKAKDGCGSGCGDAAPAGTTPDAGTPGTGTPETGTPGDGAGTPGTATPTPETPKDGTPDAGGGETPPAKDPATPDDTKEPAGAPK
jgi:hypothetical protein